MPVSDFSQVRAGQLLIGSSTSSRDAFKQQFYPPSGLIRKPPVFNHPRIYNQGVRAADKGTFITIHNALSDCTGFQLMFGNFSLSSAGESAPAASIVVGPITLEYPFQSGNFYKVLFQGRPTVTIDPWGLVLSDEVYAVKVTAGTNMGVRTYADATGSSLPIGGYDFGASGGGHNYLSQTGAGTDQTSTAGNAWRFGTDVYGYGPMQILGIPTGGVLQPVWAMIGDSIAAGQNDGGRPDYGYLARAFDDAKIPYWNLAVSGETAAVFNAPATSRIRRQIAAACSRAVVEYGVNDYSTGVAATTWRTTMNAIAADLKAMGVLAVYQPTLTPRPTTSDNFQTLANQTPHANEAIRVAMNALVRAGLANYDTYFEIADLAEPSRDSGKFIVNGTSNFYNDNIGNVGTHPSSNLTVILKTGVKTYLTPLNAA